MKKKKRDTLYSHVFFSIELENFCESAHLYFEHYSRVYYGSPAMPTALCKILGIYSITWGRKKEKHLMVMENLFYKKNVGKMFDLKGSIRNRFVRPNTSNEDKTMVLQDENLLESEG